MGNITIKVPASSSKIIDLETSDHLPVEEIRTELSSLDLPLFFEQDGGKLTFSHSPIQAKSGNSGFTPALNPDDLGNETFRSTYSCKYALYAGAMANGIASEELVIAMGRAGMMGSFGAGGLLPDRIEKSIQKIKGALPAGNFASNLLNSPSEPALEERTTDVYLQNGVTTIEASAYLGLTANLVRYRASGLSIGLDGNIQIGNHIIAKISRKEIAKRFLEPASNDLLQHLAQAGKITAEQAELASRVPMADDITVEADSGGHTDNRPLVSVLPAIIQLRNQVQKDRAYAYSVRIGAAGGIATPASALAAFMMGADYVVTGSVNQSCVEAGASEHTRKLLAQAEMTDVAMAPASDMFEMGVKVQVLKRGTMFAMRGLKLFEVYSRYDSLEDIPAKEKEKMETTILQQSFDSVWQECLRFFTARDPRQIERAEKDPKARMALVFRWYLGLSSRWSNVGEKGREMDYQIWCGPSMGAFNDWVRGTSFESIENRHAAQVNLQILTGAAYLYRIRMLEAQGIHFPSSLAQYLPA